METPPSIISTPDADFLCTTTENVSHVRFEWTVEDFYPQMYECGDMIQSEEFPPYDLQKESWTLRFYPRGYSTDENPFYLTLNPSHHSSNQLQIHFRASITFSNSHGRILHSELVPNFGGNTTDELVLLKFDRNLLSLEPTDHLIISIDLASIDNLGKKKSSKIIKLKLRWKIERFAALIAELSAQSFIESCLFTFNEPNELPAHQWSLILYPNGKTDRFKHSLSLFLEHTFGPSVRVVIRFSLIDGRGRRINTKQLPSHVLAVGERWGVGDFLKHSILLANPSDFIPGNELRLYCQIKILERQSVDERKVLPKASSVDNSIWPSLLLGAFEEKKMFDMYFKVEQQTFAAHKIVASLKSNVLEKLIKEKGTKVPVIELNDVEAQWMPFFLEFLYTNTIRKVPNKMKFVLDLLAMAKNYQMTDLKVYAETLVREVIQVENAW